MTDRREANRFDGTLAGAFQFRLARDEGAYNKTTRRSNLPFNQSEEHQGKFNTRQDIRTMWQTSWAGGALWYQPQISEASIDTFFLSRNMDTTTEPGNMFPRPLISTEAVTSMNTVANGLQTGLGTVYFFEDNGTNQGLIDWASGTPALLTNDFTVDNVDPVAMCWDAKNSRVVALFADGKVAYVAPDTAGGLVLDLNAELDVSIYYGANIFFHFGRLMVWTGDVLIEITGSADTATNAAQQIDLTGASSGTFTITVDTSGVDDPNPGIGGVTTTAAIAYNASAAVVAAAINALSNVGHVTVVLDATSKWTVTFVNPGDTNLPEMTVDFTSMGSGGPGQGNASLAVVTTIAGTPGPVAKEIYNDGMGPDALNAISYASSDNVLPEWGSRTAVSSNEGIWLAKNTEQEGKATGTITRVDRNTTGTNIGNPLATLPQGKAVLDLAWHLGSVMLSTSSDLVRVYGNDLSSYGNIPVDIHFFTENTGLGTVGSPLGAPDPDDTIFRFMGAQGDRMFIGGRSHVYVYDAVRGGLHPWLFKSDTAPFINVFSAVDGAVEVLLYTKEGGSVLSQPTAITATNADTHLLYSNWFDFNIPSEQKTVTHVTLVTDGGVQTNETITLYVDTNEEGGWVAAGSWTSADAATSKKRIATANQQTGYSFKYYLHWGLSSGTASPPTRVKGIIFHAIEGEMVTQWQLTIDGKEFRNLENQVLRPEDVRSSLETYAADQTVITYSDEFRETASTHNVKVEAVQVEAQNPAEFTATVVLTEDV